MPAIAIQLDATLSRGLRRSASRTWASVSSTRPRQIFANPDIGMGIGQIMIERKRVFTCGDALTSALSQYID